jgi:hypothetical protein
MARMCVLSVVGNSEAPNTPMRSLQCISLVLAQGRSHGHPPRRRVSEEHLSPPAAKLDGGMRRDSRAEIAER